jgi:hypothetical protein
MRRETAVAYLGIPWEELKKTDRNLGRHKQVNIWTKQHRCVEQRRWNILEMLDAVHSPWDLGEANIHYTVCKLSLIKCVSKYSPAGSREPVVSCFNIANYLERAQVKSDVISFRRKTIRQLYANKSGRVKQRWTQELKSLRVLSAVLCVAGWSLIADAE